MRTLKQKPEEIRFMFKDADEYGYFTDLRHPKMREEFENFKRLNKTPRHFALSDPERHEFDCLMAHKYKAEWYFFQDETKGGHYERNHFIPSAYRLEICKADSA
ncbi:MAG: hypothetical protein IJ447_01990 [Clostridia bacterium]|nr:hypothetical protein [Clostridia bacterium]